MNDWKTIEDIRREYGELCLDEDNIEACPIQQFKIWFAESLKSEPIDPTAMVLSTVDHNGHPNSRVVLLKGIEEDGFIFYSNYQSQKALEMQENTQVALNFYWPHLSRQVRVRGTATKISEKQSDLYFASRPISSQYSTIASKQSSKISNRAELELALDQTVAKGSTSRPSFWGGYKVTPQEMEFWQGRNNRLHDRILYQKEKHWIFCRLAP